MISGLSFIKIAVNFIQKSLFFIWTLAPTINSAALQLKNSNRNHNTFLALRWGNYFYWTMILLMQKLYYVLMQFIISGIRTWTSHQNSTSVQINRAYPFDATNHPIHFRQDEQENSNDLSLLASTSNINFSTLTLDYPIIFPQKLLVFSRNGVFQRCQT